MSTAIRRFHTLALDEKLDLTAHILGDLDAPLPAWCSTCQGRRPDGHVCVPVATKTVRKEKARRRR